MHKRRHRRLFSFAGPRAFAPHASGAHWARPPREAGAAIDDVLEHVHAAIDAVVDHLDPIIDDLHDLANEHRRSSRANGWDDRT